MARLLVCVGVLSLALPAWAVRTPSAARYTKEVYRDRHVVVRSDEHQTPAELRRVSREVARARQAAYRQTRHYSPGVVDVELLSPKLFKKITGAPAATTEGYAVDAHRLIFPGELGRSAEDADTLAHELTHIEDFRSARGRIHAIPLFMQEGKAYSIGNRYQVHLDPHYHPSVDGARRVMSALTPRQARQLFSKFRSDADAVRAGETSYRYELTGALFVEFLRTRLGGKGVPDALVRLARMTEKIGRGERYASAFRDELGVHPRRAQNEFVAYLAATAHDPAARLRGTIYAGD